MIRHEDRIQTLRLSHAWVWFLNNNTPHPLLTTLFSVAHKWKQEIQKGSINQKLALRVVIFQAMLQMFLNLLDQVEAKEEQKQYAEKHGWYHQGMWKYQRWNPEDKCLQEDETRAPVPHHVIVEKTQTLMAAVKLEGVLRRFHCTRPLGASMSGNTADFLMEMGVRPAEATQACNVLEVLQGQRPDWPCSRCKYSSRKTQKRSRLAQKLQACLR